MSEPKYIPGYGSAGAKLMILGECPNRQETEGGKSFIGSSGKELDQLLRDAGIHRSNCWLTTVSKYEVPPNFAGKLNAHTMHNTSAMVSNFRFSG